MKNIKYLFLVLSLIFVFEMFNSNQAKACTVNSGVVAKASGDGADFIDDGCDEAPALYEVVIYKLYLCTSAPTEATTSSTVVLTPCSQIFNNSSGATAVCNSRSRNSFRWNLYKTSSSDLYSWIRLYG